jgi:hypothetical protein
VLEILTSLQQESPNHEMRYFNGLKELCGGHKIREVDRWHVVSGFRGKKSRKFMHSRFAILRTSKRRGTDGPLNSQSRECIGGSR